MSSAVSIPPALSTISAAAGQHSAGLDDLLSLLTASFGRMDNIIARTTSLGGTNSPQRVETRTVHAVVRGKRKSSIADNTHNDGHAEAATNIGRRVVSAAPSDGAARRKLSLPARNHIEAPLGGTGNKGGRHGSAPAPGWRNVAGGGKSSSNVASRPKTFSRQPSGYSQSTATSHQSHRHAPHHVQHVIMKGVPAPPWNGFMLKLRPANATSTHGPLPTVMNGGAAESGGGPANAASPLSPHQPIDRHDGSSYRTAKVLSPVQRASLVRPYHPVSSSRTATAGGVDDVGFSPLPVVGGLGTQVGSASPQPQFVGAKEGAVVDRASFSSSVQRPLFASVGRRGVINVPPAASTSVSMASTAWTIGGVPSASQHHRRPAEEHLASAVTRSWLSKTHEKGYLMSIIGGHRVVPQQQYTAAESSSSQNETSPNRGEWRGSRSSSAAAAPPPPQMVVPQTTSDGDDEYRALVDASCTGGATHSFPSDATRCAQLLDRIDEELGRVQTNYDGRQISTTDSAHHRMPPPLMKTTAHHHDFTSSRKYVQGSIFERLASVGTEAHPLQSDAPLGGLAALHHHSGILTSQPPPLSGQKMRDKLPPASSVAASAVSEPANARWVGGLRNDNATAATSKGGSKRSEGQVRQTAVHRSITKPEVPPGSIWGRLYGIAEKKQKQQQQRQQQKDDVAGLHLVSPVATTTSTHPIKAKKQRAANNGPSNIAIHPNSGVAVAASPPPPPVKAVVVSGAAVVHRLYEVDMRHKEEWRQRKAHEMEVAEQNRLRKEREVISRLSRFREQQHFGANNKAPAHHHNVAVTAAVPPPPSFSSAAVVVSPSPVPAGSSATVAAVSSPPRKSSDVHRQARSALISSSHEQPSWTISEDDLIPSASLEGSPLGSQKQLVKYTSKTLPASASHRHSRTTSSSNAAATAAVQDPPGGESSSAAANGSTNMKTSDHKDLGTIPRVESPSETATSESFVLTPRGTWQRTYHAPPQSIGFKTAPIQQHKKGGPLGSSSIATSTAGGAISPHAKGAALHPAASQEQGNHTPLESNQQPVEATGGDLQVRSTSVLSADGSLSNIGGPASQRRNSRSSAGGVGFHIRTSSYVSAAPSPQQQPLGGTTSQPAAAATNNVKSSFLSPKQIPTSEYYEEILDRRVVPAVASSANTSQQPKEIRSPSQPIEENKDAMSTFQRPVIAKLDFSKLQIARRK